MDKIKLLSQEISPAKEGNQKCKGAAPSFTSTPDIKNNSEKFIEKKLAKTKIEAHLWLIKYFIDLKRVFVSKIRVEINVIVISSKMRINIKILEVLKAVKMHEIRNKGKVVFIKRFT